MFTKQLRWGAFLFALTLLAADAHANLIVDGGFEVPVIPSGTVAHFVGGDSLGGWDVVGARVSIVHTSYGEPGNGVTAFNSQEGLNSLDLTGEGNEGPTSGVQQAVATTVGETYQLSFFVWRADGESPFYVTPATVDLSIDGGPRIGYTNSDLTSGMNDWREFTVFFTATLSTTTLAFYNGTPSPTAQAGLDNVVLTLTTTAVPEPASATFLCAGVAGIIALRFRGRCHRS
jgi:hypothetical protein